jgi:hypothetical protein
MHLPLCVWCSLAPALSGSGAPCPGWLWCAHEHPAPLTSPVLAASTAMWKKTSLIVTAAVVVPTTLWMFYIEATHEHEHKTVYAHMGVRNKVRARAPHELPSLLR